MICINLKAQSWTIDIIIGIIVFLAAFFLFYTFLNQNPNAKAGILRQDASIVIKEVTSEGSLVRIIDNNEVNISKVNDLKNMGYEELKKRLGVQGDFCIYLEDGSGNLVLINNSFGGIGAPSINLSGAPCSQK